MSIPADWLETLIRVVAATLLAALIGFEREVRDKPAGLRTHMLVGLGSAAFCIIAMNVVHDLSLDQSNDAASVTLDPIRIIEGVIGGLGFLGAGAIIQSRGEVNGLTTAAGIWIVGAIGVGCGTGNYFVVGLVALVALVCLIPVRVLEHKLNIRNANLPDDQE